MTQVCRAGIIPYFRDRDGYLFFLLGEDSQTGRWADLGGTTERGENAIQTALREYGEESRYVLPLSKDEFRFMVTTPVQKNGIWSEQALFFVPVNYKSSQRDDHVCSSGTNYHENIDDLFQKTIPKTPYEAEMNRLAWIDLDTVMEMQHVARSIEQLKPVLPDFSEVL